MPFQRLSSSSALLLLLLLLLDNVVVQAAAAPPLTPQQERDRRDFLKAMQQETARRNPSNNDDPPSWTDWLWQQLRDRDLTAEPLLNNNKRHLNNNNNNQENYDFYNQDYTAPSDWNYYQDQTVDLTQYAVKYTGCQNIHTWDDDRAAQDRNNDDAAASSSSPLAMNRFVVFRLCPVDTCSAYNKRGCNYNYGEYLLPMEDYLSLMAEYQLLQFNTYCRTCYRCMRMEYYTGVVEDAQNNTDDDTDDDYLGADYWAGYNAYWGDGNGNGNRRRLSEQQQRDLGYYWIRGNNTNNNNTDDATADDDYIKWDDAADQDGDHEWYADDNGKCIYEKVCTNFKSACRSFDPSHSFYQDYFACTAFQVGNNVVYLGPHCRSDGHTIGIGIYQDEGCSQYIGDHSSLSQYSSSNSDNTWDEDSLAAYYPQSCIACSAAGEFGLITDDEYYGSTTQTYPLCTVLYETAAKCNRGLADDLAYANNGYYNQNQQQQQQYNNYNNYNYNQNQQNGNDDGNGGGDDDGQYYLQNQQANEDAVCDFIASVVENNYNEFGEVVLFTGSDFNAAHFYDPTEYVKVVRHATVPQAIGIFLSCSLFLGLLFYSVHLTRKVMYRRPWRPPTRMGGSEFYRKYGNGPLGRAYSGIVALRSGIDTMSSQLSGGSELGQFGQAGGGLGESYSFNHKRSTGSYA